MVVRFPGWCLYFDASVPELPEKNYFCPCRPDGDSIFLKEKTANDL